MYFTKWLRPVCEVYEPGVWFDFFVDDLIVPVLNNTPVEDVDAYLKEWQHVLDFLKTFQPKNLKMTISRFKNHYHSPELFEKNLNENVEKLERTNPTFTEEQLQVVELNAKPTEKQLKDKHWREKIMMIHDAYMPLKREISYYAKPDKIKVFSQPLPNGMFLITGTTKTSIAKFWVGVGVLKREKDSFREYILTPKQLNSAKYQWEKVSIQGIESKNFKRIRILS